MLKRIHRSSTMQENLSEENPVMSIEDMIQMYMDIQDYRDMRAVMLRQEETREQVIALKNAIEHHGISAALIAYADAGGSLTEAAQIVPAISLESLGETEILSEKEKILGVLEAYLADDVMATEGWIREFFASKLHYLAHMIYSIACLSIIGGATALSHGRINALPIDSEDKGTLKGIANKALLRGLRNTVIYAAVGAGAIYIMHRIAKAGHTFGTQANFNDELVKVHKRMEYAHKVMGLPLTDESKVDELKQEDKELDIKRQSFLLTSFASSGVTPDSFKKSARLFEDTVKSLKKLAEDFQSWFKGHSEAGLEKNSDEAKRFRVHANLIESSIEDAEYGLKNCRRFVKENARFFTTKKEESDDHQTTETPENK